MAKQSALFEVIVRDKPLHQQAQPGFMQSTVAWFRARRKGTGEMPVFHAVVPEAAAPAAPEPPAPAPAGLPSIRPTGRNAFRVDPDRRQMTLQLTYTAGGICAVALFTALAAAFMIGQKSARPRPALGPSADDVRKGDPQPEVMKIASMPRLSIELPQAEMSETADTANAGRSTPLPGGKSARSGNLHYVLVQSYHTSEEKMAREAIDLLARNGIDCTLEKDILGWKGRYAVVGTTGFERLASNPQLDAYVKKIKQVSDSNYSKKNSYKAFTPMTFRWRKSD